MMKKITIYLLLAFVFPSLLFGKVILTGHIKNYKKTKLILHINNTDNITFETREEKFILELDKNNSFRHEINEITHPYLSNFLEIGNNRVYVAFFPNDSLYIDLDYKNLEEFQFTGTNAQKNYFANTYLNGLFKEVNNKSIAKLNFLEYKKLKGQQLKDNLSLLNNYTSDSAFYKIQKQEIIFNFYNALSIFDKKELTEPYLECYDTANLINNQYLKDNLVYYYVLTHYFRYKYQSEASQSKIEDEYQPYYLAYRYLTDEILDKFLVYFFMYQFNFNFSEQTFDSLKSIYFDFRKKNKSKTCYKIVTQKAIDIMLIRKNE